MEDQFPSIFVSRPRPVDMGPGTGAEWAPGSPAPPSAAHLQWVFSGVIR